MGWVLNSRSPGEELLMVGFLRDKVWNEELQGAAGWCAEGGVWNAHPQLDIPNIPIFWRYIYMLRFKSGCFLLIRDAVGEGGELRVSGLTLSGGYG